MNAFGKMLNPPIESKNSKKIIGPLTPMCTLQTGITRVELREPGCLQALARTIQNLPPNTYQILILPLL